MELIGIIAALLLGLMIGEVRVNRYRKMIDDSFNETLNTLAKGIEDNYKVSKE